MPCMSCFTGSDSSIINAMIVYFDPMILGDFGFFICFFPLSLLIIWFLFLVCIYFHLQIIMNNCFYIAICHLKCLERIKSMCSLYYFGTSIILFLAILQVIRMIFSSPWNWLIMNLETHPSLTLWICLKISFPCLYFLSHLKVIIMHISLWHIAWFSILMNKVSKFLLLTGKISVEGKILFKFDMRPHNENLENYAKICRERTKKYMTKGRQIQVVFSLSIIIFLHCMYNLLCLGLILISGHWQW